VPWNSASSFSAPASPIPPIGLNGVGYGVGSLESLGASDSEATAGSVCAVGSSVKERAT
jgi:hypothetical protein